MHDSFSDSSAQLDNFHHLEEVIAELEILYSDMQELEVEAMDKLADLDASYVESARNLLHYLAVRRHDIRHLQETLAAEGLSTLTGTESHILQTVEKLLLLLKKLVGKEVIDLPLKSTAISAQDGRNLLHQHTEALLGREPAFRRVRILVTMPREAAESPALLRSLLMQGMDCMRINCAHDSEEIWARMIENLRIAELETHKSCRILMDLAGPKLRTGPVELAPSVIKWRPHRDEYGRVIAPARIWLHPQEVDSYFPKEADAYLPVPQEWLKSLAIGDRIDFVDQRGSRRFLWVVGVEADCRWAEAVRTAYVAEGTSLCISSRTNRKYQRRILSTQVGKLPAKERPILVKKGEVLILTRELLPGCRSRYNPKGQLIASARIGCTLPQVFSDARVGERIWLNDGRVGGVIESVDADFLHVRITQASLSGEKIRADQGINLPDSTLHLPALTEKDLADLAFVAKHANMVGYSFVRSASDVDELEGRLKTLGGGNLGIVLKIETKRAFEQLPNLLLASMRTPCDGVMIARGDLAIECGFERMAEVQEEILWICEAAHVPVIWATQVLENLAKEGMPSRAEISDAAKGQRAECVMLNKGPHILEAVRVLDDILRRMQAHQNKMRPMLRPLELARRFPAE